MTIEKEITLQQRFAEICCKVEIGGCKSANFTIIFVYAQNIGHMTCYDDAVVLGLRIHIVRYSNERIETGGVSFKK